VTRETLLSLLNWLDGKKTYLLAAALVIYVIGSDAGWWPLNESVLALGGALSLGTLRSAVRKAQPSANNPPPKE
jgi:hypothetical protein